MTVSTDAILFYGYCWDDEARWPWLIDEEDEDNGEDWEDRYARARGIIKPTAPYPERTDSHGRTPTDYTPAEQTLIEEHVAYMYRKYELAETSSCVVSTHCTRECPMPYVAVRASLVRSSRGDMAEIKSLAIDPAWPDQLAEFCRIMGIQTNGLRPTWWLVSELTTSKVLRHAPPTSQ